MERAWYLLRDGQVFGPVSDEQLTQSVAAGRVLPTDRLNVAGRPDWLVAADVPGLLPVAASAPLPPSAVPEPSPAVMRTARMTCMSCFSESAVEFQAGTATVPCPACGTALPTGEENDGAAEAAFGTFDSPEALKARLQKKVADAYAAEAAQMGILKGVARGIARG